MRVLRRFLSLSLAITLLCGFRAAPPMTPSNATPTPIATASGQALTREDLAAWLDGFVPNAIASGDVAGAVVVVVKDGGVLFEKGYGYADVAAKRPVDPETTLFRPGSVSKLFTWTAVMQLVEAGKLDLDRDVNTYLDFRIPERNDGPITLRHIMTHTAGFEEQIKGLIVSDPRDLVPLQRYVRESTPVRIYKAGSTPAYSNYATAVAGYIVARVSGESFDDYVEHHIFQPLGMTHASFRQPLPTALATDMSKGYAVASQPEKPYEIVVAAPAGSLAASGADMAKFMLAHLGDGEIDGRRILGAETARTMHTTPTDMIPPLHRMDLGFYEQDYNGHRVISHGGDTQSFHSYLHLLLDDHVGLFVSVNSAGRPGAALRQPLFEGFMNRYFPAPHDVVPLDAETAKRHAAEIAGPYENSRRPDTTFLSIVGLLAPLKIVDNGDGTISLPMFKYRNEEPRRYVEVAPYLWRDPVTFNRLAARVENGRIVRVSADEISPFMVLERPPLARSMTWLLPSTLVAVVATFGTALLWPIAAISRRRHGVELRIRGAALRAHRASRIACAVIAATTAGWLGLIAFEGEALTASLDPLLAVLHALSVVAYGGGGIVLLWSALAAFRFGRPLLARGWSVVLSFSGLVFFWNALVFHLMNFSSHY